MLLNFVLVLQAAMALYRGLGFCEVDMLPLSDTSWPQRKLLKLELLETEEESCCEDECSEVEDRLPRG
jgi:hypothetical protein